MNKREKKAVRRRNYVQAQYHKIEHMKRLIAHDEINLQSMINYGKYTTFQWNIYSKPGYWNSSRR